MEVSVEDFKNGVGLKDGDTVIVIGVKGGREQQTYCEPIVLVVRSISADAMRDRFFFEERVLIDNSPNPKVITFRNDLMFRRKPVNLDSPRFRLAMDLLLAEQLIEVGRDLILLQDGTTDEVQ